MVRRLAAVLAADVVGYSRLMGSDEAATLQALRTLRFDVMEPAFEHHRGRVAKLMGDGVLAEFASVVDAVAAAVAIQEQVPKTFGELSTDRKVEIRIGINVGDIVVEDGDIFGDGVNIAARLQEVAKPGGIALSENAYRELRGKFDLPFEDVGAKSLKNILEPIRTWLWSPAKPGAQPLAAQPTVSDTGRPSIAVLPFENLSSDSEQEFLADGMAEDIISGLSKFRWLLVVARRSTFTFKGQSKDVREIASELGARYVVEGSVRRAGNRIRVMAQLIDAKTGNQIWSERYDREIDDLFAVQDEVSDAVIKAIAPEIGQSEIDRARRTPPENLDAWGLYQRGLAIEMSGEPADIEDSISLFDRSRRADPNFVDAMAMAALQRARLVYFFRSENSENLIKEAEDLLQSAMRLDARNALCHFAQGRLLDLLGNSEVGIEKCEEGIELDPNSVLGYIQLASVYSGVGRWEDSLRSYEQVLVLSPKDAHSSSVFAGRAYNLFYIGQYEEAVDSARRALQGQNPRYWAALMLVAALAKLDRPQELDAAKAVLFRMRPDITVSSVATIRNLSRKEFLDALREAGLPE